MTKKYIRKLTRVSTHSYSITIPKDIIRELKWRERQKLTLIFDNKKKEFKVMDWNKHD